jgi:uncharacterized protein (DUF2336 family)
MPLHKLDRPTDHAALLGAVVDQFVGRPAHPVGDVRQFEQLALGLIDIVDCDAAARILRPLALHPEAPQSIFDRLLAKGGACAALALQFSPTLARTALMAAARGAEPALACAAARRCDLGRDIVEALLQRGEAGTLRALAANSTLRLDMAARRVLAEAARDDLALARLLLDRDDFGGEADGLFLAATRPERAEIILNACRRALLSGRIESAVAEPALATQLDAAARRGDRAGMAGILAAALACREDRADALLADARGEPMALALAALGVDADAAARIFLNAAWAFADGTGRARPMSALVRAVPQRAALEIVAAITGAAPEARGAMAAGSIAAETRFAATERRRGAQTGGRAPRFDRSA